MTGWQAIDYSLEPFKILMKCWARR